MKPEPTNLSSCCGAPMEYQIVQSKEGEESYEICLMCQHYCDIQTKPPKLTPEQVAKVRWPSAADCGYAYIFRNAPSNDDLKLYCDWAIRHALQPLMEGDDEK